MTDLETQVANAELYTSIRRTLHVEQLLLAVIRKRTADHSPSAIAQFERVAALESALALFAANISPRTPSTLAEIATLNEEDGK